MKKKRTYEAPEMEVFTMKMERMCAETTMSLYNEPPTERAAKERLDNVYLGDLW